MDMDMDMDMLKDMDMDVEKDTDEDMELRRLVSFSYKRICFVRNNQYHIKNWIEGHVPHNRRMQIWNSVYGIPRNFVKLLFSEFGGMAWNFIPIPTEVWKDGSKNFRRNSVDTLVYRMFSLGRI
jgi:hypothetical protein